jgi:hypothetical protein
VELAAAQRWRLFELRSREMDLEEIFHRVLSDQQSAISGQPKEG